MINTASADAYGADGSFVIFRQLDKYSGSVASRFVCRLRPRYTAKPARQTVALIGIYTTKSLLYS